MINIRRKIDKARACSVLELVKGLRHIMLMETARDRASVLYNVWRQGIGCEDAFCVGRQWAGASCFFNGVSQLRAANVANQNLIASVLDDGEALEFVVAYQVLCFSDGEIRRWERQRVVGHDSRHWHVEDMVFFIVQERESIEPDGSVCDAAFSKAVTDCFGNADDNLHSY
jgi:hypothetical protein